MMEHLERHHLLCIRQSGFRLRRSAADLYLLLSLKLSAALDRGEGTAAVDLNRYGVLDRVWHTALPTKLRAA